MVQPGIIGYTPTGGAGGYAPGFIGLYQINVRVNENAPVGSAVALDVVVDGVPSQTSRIAVR